MTPNPHHHPPPTAMEGVEGTAGPMGGASTATTSGSTTTTSSSSSDGSVRKYHHHAHTGEGGQSEGKDAPEQSPQPLAATAPASSPPSTPTPTPNLPLPDQVIYQTEPLDGTFQVDYSPRNSLGRGLNSWVRPAVHRATGQAYAVKSVRSFKRREVALLQQEAYILQRIGSCRFPHMPTPNFYAHPSIVQVYGIYQDPAAVHLVMEMCRGGEVYDLVQYAAQKGKLVSERAAALIVTQVVEAVRYCHDRHDVVHRDLKLENILFRLPATSGNGASRRSSSTTLDNIDTEVRLIDFGLAVVHPRGAPPLTEHVGSPYYVAPEVLRRSYDRACDVWSIGVLTYALLCGQAPFDGETELEIFQSIVGHPDGPPPMRHPAWQTTLSPSAKNFVLTCLQRDPRARPTANVLSQHEWLLDGGDVDLSDKMSTGSASSRASRQGRGWRRFFRRDAK